MKSNRNTAFVCIVGFIVTIIGLLILTYILKVKTDNLIIQILISIMTGFVVAIVLALTSYFYYRNEFFNSLYSELFRLFTIADIFYKKINEKKYCELNIKEFEIDINFLVGLIKLEQEYCDKISVNDYFAMLKQNNKIFKTLIKFFRVNASFHSFKILISNFQIKLNEYKIIELKINSLSDKKNNGSYVDTTSEEVESNLESNLILRNENINCILRDFSEIKENSFICLNELYCYLSDLNCVFPCKLPLPEMVKDTIVTGEV